jgi:hypothetical protein
MAAEAQIFANRRLGRRIVLNLGHLDFDIVSDFDIRISDFNHSGCFMQNKPNLLYAQMNISSVITKDYENIANCKLGENKPNSNPIKANTNPIRTQYEPKTNPIKPNLVRHSLGEGGFKRDFAKMGHHEYFLFVLRLVC